MFRRTINEGVIGGIWAPYRLAAATAAPLSYTGYYTGPAFQNNPLPFMYKLASVNLVITSDKSLWTRAVVLEMCEDSAIAKNTSTDIPINLKPRKLDFRRAPSVDKNGSTATGTDNNDFATGMGWFPGYAINLETGERLNIAFGENSALSGGVYEQNGGDMKWNPTSATTDSIPWIAGTKGPVLGGQHYIYIFGHNNENTPAGVTPTDTINVPRYDKGNRIREILAMDDNFPFVQKKRHLFADAMWVNIPMLVKGHSLLESDVTIKLRVGKSYNLGYSAAFYKPTPTTFLYTDTSTTPQNNNRPMYSFNTEGIATHTGVTDLAKSALDLIRVVPNPYYAFSSYETSMLDNRVKITNLPEKCTVSIYNLSGTLIRKFKKGEPSTNHTPKVFTDASSWHDGSLDWDLKNTAGIPISSGVYIIHVEVYDVNDGKTVIGEKVVKWFGIMRPIDLDSF